MTKAILTKPFSEHGKCASFRSYAVLCIAVCTIATAPLSLCADQKAMGPAIGADKKLIKWGVDAPSCEEYRDQIEQIKQLPFDGWVVHATVHVNGGTAIIQGQASSTHRFTYNDLKHNVDAMNAAKSSKLTDNFLELRTAADDLVAKDANDKEVGRIKIEHPDWFSDADFEIVSSNWALMARVARESGMKGFMLDFEQWGHTNGKYPRPWDYKFLVKHNKGQIPSFEEHQRMYRRRGRELAVAVCETFPDIILLSYMTLHNGAYGLIDTLHDLDPNLSGLANTNHGLYPAFLDGLLEGIPADSKTVLIDGGSLYGANLNKRFIGYKNYGYADNFKFSKVSKSAKSRMKLAFGTWVDSRGWRTKPDWSWPWLEKSPYWANQFTPEELEHAFYYALLNADKYAWVWNERARFLSNCGWTMKGPANVPDDYLQALKNCKKPHQMVFKRNDRGALNDPPPPKLTPYDEQKVFGSLTQKYNYVTDLPNTWRFWADTENISTFGGGPVGKVNWQLNGKSYKDWDTIRIDDYWENQGVKFNGHAWYQTHFDVPASLAGKKSMLHFGGITLHPVVRAQIHINGKLLWAMPDLEPKHPVLVLDITEAAKPGQKNMIAVKIFNYAGPGGIYRPVRLATFSQKQNQAK